MGLFRRIPRQSPATFVAPGGALLLMAGALVTALAGAERAAAVLLVAAVALDVAAIHVTDSVFSRVLVRDLRFEHVAVSAAILVLIAESQVRPLTVAVVLAISGSVVDAMTQRFLVRGLDARNVPAVDRYRNSFRLADDTSRPYQRVAGGLSTAMLGALGVLAAVVAIGGSSSQLAVGAWVAAGTVVVVVALRGAGVVVTAVSQQRLAALISEHAAQTPPRVLLHFSAAGRNSLYQARDWIELLERSPQTSWIVVREAVLLEPVAALTSRPVICVRRFSDLDLVVVPGITRVALYCNTQTTNHTLVRFRGMTHVQLHHGDSDKAGTTAPPQRLYDVHFVPGERMRRLLVAADVARPDAVRVIGLPWIGDSRLSARVDGGSRVLYAPTWEGFHDDTRYSSLPASGRRLVEHIGARSDLTLDLRLHPLTGHADRSLMPVAAAVRRATVRSGGTVIDADAGSIDDDLGSAAVTITDISSVIAKALVHDCPVIVIDETGRSVEDLQQQFPLLAAATVVGSDLGGLDDAIDDALGADALRSVRAAVRADAVDTSITGPDAFYREIEKLLEGAAPVPGTGSES